MVRGGRKREQKAACCNVMLECQPDISSPLQCSEPVGDGTLVSTYIVGRRRHHRQLSVDLGEKPTEPSLTNSDCFYYVVGGRDLESRQSALLHDVSTRAVRCQSSTLMMDGEPEPHLIHRADDALHDAADNLSSSLPSSSVVDTVIVSCFVIVCWMVSRLVERLLT